MSDATRVTCARCGAAIVRSWSSHAVSADESHFDVAQDGTGHAFRVHATVACSWACLAVLAAQEAVRRGGHVETALRIVAERERQRTAEGWTDSHDREHDAGILAAAAVCYATAHSAYHDHDPLLVPHGWPWLPETWKPKDITKDLVRAGALLAAEVDRTAPPRQEPF